jgi:hypothetical protein
VLPKILDGHKAKFSVKDGNGNKCPFIFADTPLAKRLSGLTQIMDDLVHAKELAQLINTIEHGELKYSLWMSAVVTYGKVFAGAKGRKIKLEDKHVIDVNSEALNFHKDLLELRNEFFAHAGNNPYELSNVGVILSPDLNNKAVIGVNHLNIKKRSVTDEFIKPFCHLCTELYKVVEAMGEPIHEKVLNEYENKDLNELYELASKQT